MGFSRPLETSITLYSQSHFDGSGFEEVCHYFLLCCFRKPHGEDLTRATIIPFRVLLVAPVA